MLLDLVECRSHTLRVVQIRANSCRLAAVGFDLVDNRVEVGEVAREEHDGVRQGEFAGDAGSSTRANTGDNGIRFGHF